MIESEVATLLGVVVAHDRRTLGDMDVQVWFRHLERFPYQDCEDAVFAHYGKTRDFIMPSDVLAHVKAVVRERLRRAGTLVPPEGLPVGESQQWLREATRRVSEGLDGVKAIGGHGRP